MQRSGDAAPSSPSSPLPIHPTPSLRMPPTSTSSHMPPSAPPSALTAEALALASHATTRLTALTTAAATARSTLALELAHARQRVQKRHDETAAHQARAADLVDRAAAALTVRALDVDNALLCVAQRHLALAETRHALSARDTALCERDSALRERDAVLCARECALAARNASLRYAAVDQAQLHGKARALCVRERALADAEVIQRDRLAARRAAFAQREQVLERRERDTDEALAARYAAVEAREAAVASAESDLHQHRAEMLATFEDSRLHFWAHQQELSAMLAEQVNQLVALQTDLRRDFEHGAGFARQSLMHVRHSIAQLGSDVDHVYRSPDNANAGDTDQLLQKPLADLALCEDRIEDSHLTAVGQSDLPPYLPWKENNKQKE